MADAFTRPSFHRSTFFAVNLLRRSRAKQQDYPSEAHSYTRSIHALSSGRVLNFVDAPGASCTQRARRPLRSTRLLNLSGDHSNITRFPV